MRLENISAAARALRRAPGFFALSVLSLGVGIGLSTVTFAFEAASLNPKLPYADAGQLRFADFKIADWKHAPLLSDQVAVLRSMPAIEAVTVRGTDVHSKVQANGLSAEREVTRFPANFFDVMGLHPLLGRLLTVDEMHTGSAVLISEQLWRRAFLARQDLSAAQVTMDGHSLRVVGVLPAAVRYLGGSDIWLPYPSEHDLDVLNAAHWTSPPILRLRRGTARAAIDSQISLVAARLTAARHASPGELPFKLGLKPLSYSHLSNLDIILIGISIGILLIAASNVAALTLARALTRRRDLALRVALGASRGVIAREMLAEVGVIAIFGAVLGAVFGTVLIGVLRQMMPDDLIAHWGMRPPAITASLFAYVSIGLVVSIAIAGGIPAWRASRLDPSETLKDNAGTTTGRARSEFRLLVIGELAIAMVLVMLTSLLAMSSRNLATFDFGSDFQRVIEARVSFGLSSGDTVPAAEWLAYYSSALERVRTVPGVAVASTFIPTGVRGLDIVSQPTFGAGRTLVQPVGAFVDVSPEAFRTLGVRVIEGRDFSDGDRASGDAIILAERDARVLFPRRNAIGSTVKIGGERSKFPWMRVIGVVSDFHTNTSGWADPEFFISTQDVAKRSDLRIIVRPTGADPRLATAVERTLANSLPPNSSVQVSKMSGFFDSELQRVEFFTRIITFIGACALLLAVGGLFSVLSYTVGSRMREFAVRVALGATPQQVVAVVLKNGLEFALGGTAIGALLSFWASAGIAAMFYGIKVTDPVALVIAEAALLAVAMGASLVPALRAAKADPIEVLRAS